MKHYKLLMASLLLAIGGGNAVAQTTENQPLLIQKNSFGEAISDFSTLIVDDNKFTIEAEATAGVEIRLRSKTKGFSYTPKNTGKIRFVRKNSKTFVYEQNVYKGVASECLIFPEITDDNVITSTDNLLANPSFETCGDKIKNDKYKFGDPWISNVTPAEYGIRIGKNSKCNSGSMVLVWRGTKNSNYISQNLSSKIKPNTLYKIALSQVDGGNATADFNVGFGTAKGELDLVSSKVRLGNGLNGKKYVEITTPPTIEGDVYFTFKNTSTNTSSSGTDPVTQLDWISVAESLSSTGATSAVYADNVAYAPEEIGDYTSGAIYTEAIENPSFETNNLSPWLSSKIGDTGVKLNSNSNYTINNADGKYIFNTWTGDNSEKYIKQTLTDLPRGYYTVTALVASDAGNTIKIYAGDKYIVAQASSEGKSVGVEYSTPKVRVVDGTLEIGATSTSWYKMDNFRLTYYGPYSEFLKEEYSQVKKDGNALLHNEEYSLINGDERATILSLLNSKEPVNDSEYEAAIEKLNTAISTFTEAAPKYLALVDAKALDQAKLAYASEEKYTKFTASKEVTPTTAADAEAKAKAIIAARRAYVESNGKAEGVVGAEDCTSKVKNPTFTASDGKGSLDGWNHSQSGGEEGALNDEIWTNADGNKVGYYYNYNNNGANNQHVYQEVTGLTAGRYIVTIKARAKKGFNLYLLINNEKKEDINEIGNAGGVFDRGWNDYTAEFTVGADGKVKIEVANMPSSNQAGWFGFGDVRLVRLSEAVTLDEAADNVIEAKEAADVTLKRKFVANKWNTLVLPFAVSDADVKTTFGADAKIVEYRNADDANINFTTSTKGIEANVPVLIMPAAVNAEDTYTFNSVSIVVADPKADGKSYSFVGSYKPYNLVNDDYMLYADKWWKTETGDKYTIKAFRAYIKANTPAAAKQLNLVIDGQTTGLKLNTVNGNIEGETYNIAGQRVANSYKGLIIKNGKKIIKK